jgi:hypothetical protein
LHCLQIDSRSFGNVGSFIRHRKIQLRVREGSVLSAPVADTEAASAGPMLLRRLVYNNRRDSSSGLKMALFAARDIAADTELLI